MTDSQKRVRIGCAAAMWGDTETATPQLVCQGNIDYLIFDYLAEVTMSILAGARMRNPEEGYGIDFVKREMSRWAADIASRGIKVVTNAGGINPESCAKALQAVLDEQGLDLRIAVIHGDNLASRRKQLKELDIREMDSGAPLPPVCFTMNAYLGAIPIAAALGKGADIVITGRCVDSALALGPLMHEFGWSVDDHDRLAQGSLLGHIIECGAQATGGLFTDWEQVPGYDNMGFPIAECSDDGSFVVSKVEDTGGIINRGTISEQLVYEIGDPARYVLPDVICDFTGVQVEEIGPNQVRVSGAKGLQAPQQYKVSATYQDGFRVIGSCLLAGRNAREKAEKVSDAIFAKVRRLFTEHGFDDFSEVSVELLGAESTYGEHARTRDCREIVMKLGAAHKDKKALVLFTREIAHAGVGMAPGLTGLVGGRPSVYPKIRHFGFLVPKSITEVEIDIDGERSSVEIPAGSSTPEPAASVRALPAPADCDASVPLLQLAWGRSGDKGNHANIGIVARKAQYLPYIRAALTEAAVAGWMRHVLHPDLGRVRVYDLPGPLAVNCLLENSLGGGGVASLRIDPQGKAYAQQLLEMPIPVPASLARDLAQH